MHSDHWLERLLSSLSVEEVCGTRQRCEGFSALRPKRARDGESVYGDVVCMPNDLLSHVLEPMITVEN